MNRRIKRKIMDRIFKKLMKGEQLSEFETKHLDQLGKRARTTLSNVASRPAKIDVHAGNKLVSSSVVDRFPHRIEAKSTLPSHLRAAEKSEQARQDAFDSLIYATEAMQEATVVAAVEEPTKWDKVKSKVKGWFSR